MKIYAVSILAFSPLHDVDLNQENTYVEHIPALIPSESVDTLREHVRQYALNRWKPEEGWRDHQAAVMTVTDSFYEAAGNALGAGIIDWSPEEGQILKLYGEDL